MTCIFIKFFTFIVFILSFSQAYAIDDYIVDIRQISTSGKTIVIDSGHVSEIGANDYGVLLKKEVFDDGRTVFRPVAKLRAIKVYTNESIWVIYKTFIRKEIKAGRGLFLFSETALLRGRTELSVKRTKLVTANGESQEVKDFLLEGDRLRKKSAKYSVLSRTHSKKPKFDKDIELIDVEKWDKSFQDNKFYASGLYRSPYAKEFNERRKVHTFEKMVVAFLNKYNSPSYDYDAFYAEQKRSDGLDEMPANTIYQTYRKSYDREIQNKAAKEEKFYGNILKKGDAWSDDYSDEELSELVNNLSIVKEKHRRQKLLAFKYNYQIYSSFGLNLLNNENTNDKETTQPSKYDFELAWEGYLFKKLQELKNFTLEVSLRRAQDGYNGGSSNVTSLSYSMAFHVNWYPYYGPNIMQRNIVYVGLLARYGFARLSSEAAGEVGNYQLSSFPGLRGGVKYNFNNSFGVRVTTAFENISVDRIVRSADQGSLPDRANYYEGKIGFGLSKFY
jgi:hypothetical protein